MYATAPSWSIPGKKKCEQVATTPSPNGYYPEKWKTLHSPSWKIGKSERNKENNNDIPGPGHYNTAKSHACSQFGKFNHQNYHILKQQQNPAPNSYSPNYQFTRPTTPSSKISSKPKETNPFNGPGPGYYQPSLINKNGKSNIKIGNQKRFLTQKVEGPGPQSYTPVADNFKKVAVGFTKQDKKLQSYQNEQIRIPGPGSYEIQDHFKENLKQNKGFSISSKMKQSMSTESPGPGQYNPNYVSQPQSPKISMKGKYKNSKVQYSPGPAEYSVKNVFHNQNHGYSVGKNQRSTINVFTKSPGPGEYDPKILLYQTPKYSMHGSRVEQSKCLSPGPGSYNPDKNAVKRRPQSAKIGNSKRCQIQKSIGPGPGQYELRTRPETSCNKFTKQTRGKKHTEVWPGPADYQIQQIFGQTPCYLRKK